MKYSFRKDEAGRVFLFVFFFRLLMLPAVISRLVPINLWSNYCFYCQNLCGMMLNKPLTKGAIHLEEIPQSTSQTVRNE